MRKDNGAGLVELFFKVVLGIEEKREEIVDYRARDGRRCG